MTIQHQPIYNSFRLNVQVLLAPLLALVNTGETVQHTSATCSFIGSLVTEDDDRNIKAALCGLLIQGRILQLIRRKTADQQFELHFALKAKIAFPIYKRSSSRTVWI